MGHVKSFPWILELSSSSAFGPMVMDDAVLLVPDFKNPGRTIVTHKGQHVAMSIEHAESYKDRYERLKLLD